MMLARYGESKTFSTDFHNENGRILDRKRPENAN
jgi:hypothetical protein